VHITNSFSHFVSLVFGWMKVNLFDHDQVFAAAGFGGAATITVQCVCKSVFLAREWEKVVALVEAALDIECRSSPTIRQRGRVAVLKIIAKTKFNEFLGQRKLASDTRGQSTRAVAKVTGMKGSKPSKAVPNRTVVPHPQAFTYVAASRY
jgi:hypothetical protein